MKKTRKIFGYALLKPWLGSSGSIASDNPLLEKNGNAGCVKCFCRNLALAGLRQRFPSAGEDELQRRLADLLLGPDLARKVYGELSEVA